MIGKSVYFLSLNIAKVEFEGYFRHGRGSVTAVSIISVLVSYIQSKPDQTILIEGVRPQKGSAERLVLSSYHAGLVKLENFRENDVKERQEGQVSRAALGRHYGSLFLVPSQDVGRYVPYSTCIASKSSHDPTAYCTAPVYGEAGTRNCQGT